MKNTLHIFFFFAVFSWCNLDAQTNNIDFELTPAGTYTTANAVSGWTVSSRTATSCNSSTVWTAGSPEFSIIATPQLSIPNIGTLPNSPLGGTVVAQLNNYTANSLVTKLTHTIAVTSTSKYFHFAYAGIWQDGNHICCEQAGFKVRIKDSLGNVSQCPSFSLAGVGCQYVPSYTLTNGISYTSWQVKEIDLTPYLNSVATIEIIVNDCTCGSHFGTAFFDFAPITFLNGTCYCSVGSSTQSVEFCPGASIATIEAPHGFTEYLWTSPVGYPISSSQSTLANLTVTNPLVGNIYTLNLFSLESSCRFQTTYTLLSTPLSVLGIASSSSCLNGTSGAANVVAGGSPVSGYTYTWYNSLNAVVGTSATVGNLSAGIYSLVVGSNSSQSLSCGVITATTEVGVRPNTETSELKPFCGLEAHLSYPSGSNHQWYNNLTPITASLGGTAPSYTVNTPINGAIYRLSYISQQGCHDSIKLTLVPTSSGSFSLLSNPTICESATNGTVVISMTAAAGAPQGSNSFSVFSVGSTAPYSSSASFISLNTYTATSLSAGSTYSVTGFDGLCKYSTSFIVPALSFDYSLTPSNSPTLCSGNGLAANINFSSTPTVGQYTYSWSPSALLFGATSQNAILNPTISPGNQITLTYSVVVTPTLANCPLTKTLSITVINPVTPTISSIPILCGGSWSAYSISVNPPGGTFSGGGIGFTSIGTIMPAFSSIGTFSFVYTAPPQGSCTSTTSGTYTVDYSPVINSLGNQLSICEGQAANLSVTCYGSYTWSTGMTNGPITVTPSTTTSYSVFTLNAAHTCSTEAVLTLTVVPIPTISISGNSICLGSSGTLTASGATSYSWSNGSTSSVIIVPPINGTSYTVLGANSQTCVNTSSTVLNIIPVPTITISGNSSVCDGQPVTLLGSGASTYHWNNTTLGAILSLTPTSTSVFTLTGIDILTNCSAIKTITVNVLPNPTLSIVGDTTFCLGETKSLSVQGANIYSWSNGSNSSSISIAPIHNTTYTLLGTNTLGSCSSSKTISILVSPCTSIEKNMLSDGAFVYPNPSNGNYFIEAENISTIIVTDELGKIIVEEHFKKENYQLDLSKFQNGIYTLQLFYNQQIKTIKLIKTE